MPHPRCNHAIELCSCPYRAHFLYPYVYPGRRPGLMVVAPSGRNNTATTTPNERICNQGALKAQLHIARGETPGHRAFPTISARCKCNCINIEGLKNGNGIAISSKWRGAKGFGETLKRCNRRQKAGCKPGSGVGTGLQPLCFGGC